jgi:hypothetical protein
MAGLSKAHLRPAPTKPYSNRWLSSTHDSLSLEHGSQSALADPPAAPRATGPRPAFAHPRQGMQGMHASCVWEGT